MLTAEKRIFVKSKSTCVRLPVNKFYLLHVLLLIALFSDAQPVGRLSTDSIAVSKKRVIIITATNVSIWTMSFIALNKSWYADYPKSAFHLFNDIPEWKQQDKAGHLWTNYHITRLSSEMWKWTGLPHRKSVVLGGISGVAYQSIIEIQDGFSAEWGFSWSDMAANVAGAGAFVAQELGWKEQRIQVKLSYWPYDYPRELLTRRNQLFGKSGYERILKDYNSQTYWASANLAKFFPSSKLPRWLSISVGYSADGMYGGTTNTWTDKEGNAFNRTDIKRVRRFYIAPDVDLTQIKTNSGLLKTVFYVVNMVKFPAPALEINSGGRVKFHYVKF